ncbi:MAG: nucleotide-binding domain-containing protein [Acidimicrobiales bacterium]
MKFVDVFESFLRTEVNLNKTRLNTLEDRLSAVESFITDEATFGPAFLELIPAGSWAHRSIIKPVTANDGFDADVLLHMEEQTAWQPKDYIENLYWSFRGSANYKDRLQRKTRCLRITYAGEFHIDLVPFIERAGLYYITNRLVPEDTGKLEASNPIAVTDWIDARQRLTNGSFIKVVRLLKYLRDYKNTFNCKSIILTTLLGEQVNEIEAMLAPDRYRDVPATLNTLLGKLADSLPLTMPAVFDPGGTGDNFTDRYREGWDYDNFRAQIRRYATKVASAYAETSRPKAIAAWQEIFGDEFDPDTLDRVSALAPLSASVPWEREEQIQDRFPVQIDPNYRLKIKGEVVPKMGFRNLDLTQRGYRVPKRRTLKFRVVNLTVPAPYEIHWKVRNGDREAFDANQLRGEISRDDGSRIKTETTSYKGTHYVECYVVKNSIVVAKDRQTVIVT